MSWIRVVQLEAEHRQLRVANNDLEILVDIVKPVDLRAQMPIKAAQLPAQLVVQQLLRTKRRRRAEAHRDVKAAGPKTG